MESAHGLLKGGSLQINPSGFWGQERTSRHDDTSCACLVKPDISVQKASEYTANNLQVYPYLGQIKF